MSFWVLIQVFIDLVFVAGVVAIVSRTRRGNAEDPRLSKGLQLLQSKIAVLEDLSDRTEVQVQQLTALLEQKCRDIQQKVQMADKQIHKIEQSMQKSLEVAKIFQDRIPHTEIVERQNTIKYVKAARLAHQGKSPQEIAAQVDLSLSEIEMIAKVNKDQLMFCEESLPEWAQQSTRPAQIGMETSGDVDAFQESRIDMETPLSREMPVDLSKAFEVPEADQDALRKLGDAFRKACETANQLQQQVPQGFVEGPRSPSESSPVNTSAPFGVTASRKTDSQVRPVQFPRIDMVKPSTKLR